MKSGARLALAVLSRTAVLGLLVAAGTMPAPAPTADHGPVVREPVTLPDLDHNRYPGCVHPARFEGIPATAVVVTMGGDVRRVPFDQAWAAGASRDKADDVWTIGVCS